MAKRATTKSTLISRSSTPSKHYTKYRLPSGVVVSSKLEALIAEELDQLGVPYQYETQRLPYTVERLYIPDFILPNGIIVEAKGWFLSEDRRKMKLVKKQYPNLDIRMLFQKGKLDQPGQASKATNREWCRKNGFPCAEGTIPLEWIHERSPVLS